MNTGVASEAALTALAQDAGAHALTWYLGLLALLVVAEFLAWPALPQVPSRGAIDAPVRRDPFFLPWTAVALVAVGAACFTLIGHAVGADGEFVRIDHAFLDALRAGVPPWAVQIFGWITLLGDGRTLAVVCIAGAAVLLARGQRALALALVVAVGGNGLLDDLLKRSFDRLRPAHQDGLPLAHGWSFPSGHAAGAVVAYGMLAYVAMRTLPRRWHLPTLVAATALAFSVGWSRIFLEAHFASDVLAAFASGTAWLTLCVITTESWLRGWRPRGPHEPARRGSAQGCRPGHGPALVLLIVGFAALRLALAATLPLLPEEAYYWSWSRHLDWSYFDHPPLATYSIALTTALFGQTVFGIKLASVLWALGWNLLWVRLVLDLYDDRRLAFWSVAALNLTVLYEIFGVGPTPDAPLIFAWTGAIWAVGRASGFGPPGGPLPPSVARERRRPVGQGRWWFVAGAFIGLSWLAKYSGVLLLPVVLLYLLTSPAQRRWLRRPEPWLAALLALAIFAPVLWWNAQHDWVSLAFQGSRRVGEMDGFKPRYFALLVVTQFLLLTPYGFVVAIGALVRGAKEAWARRLDDRARLLLLSGAVPIVLFTLISLRSLVKLNWLAPAYWSLMILGVRHLLAHDDGVRRLTRGLASSAALLLAAGIVVAIPNIPIPGDLNTWSGWHETALQVEKAEAAARAGGRATFVFSPSYRTSSMLRFFLPGQPRTYAQDIYGDAALQFDYFPLPREMKGDTGILVLTDQDRKSLDRQQLAAYFDTVELVDAAETSAFGRTTRRTEIYRCTGYKGHPRWPAAGMQGRDHG